MTLLKWTTERLSEATTPTHEKVLVITNDVDIAATPPDLVRFAGRRIWVFSKRKKPQTRRFFLFSSTQVQSFHVAHQRFE